MKIFSAFVCSLVAALAAGAAAQDVSPQTNSYLQTNLVSNHRGAARQVDIQLTNASAIAYLPGQPSFVTNERAGTVRAYYPAGFEEIPGVLLISPPEGNTRPTRPTAVVANPTSKFEFESLGAPAQYIFAAENGTISGWAEAGGDFEQVTLLALDRSKQDDVYEGMTIMTNDCCEPVLGVTDFHHATVRCISNEFVAFQCPERFVDPHLPVHYAPYGIQQIGSEVYVTFVEQDSQKERPVPGKGKGLVDDFDWKGRFLRRFATGGTLNVPWSVVKAAPQFGSFANDILIGNFGDGTISAFDAKTGAFRGQLRNAEGEVIVNPGLRGMVFGSSGVGDPNTLYFTAGPENKADGLLGELVPSLEKID
jgi:uncharacterized protein (TIGR03118 family)